MTVGELKMLGGRYGGSRHGHDAQTPTKYNFKAPEALRNYGREIRSVLVPIQVIRSYLHRSTRKRLARPVRKRRTGGKKAAAPYCMLVYTRLYLALSRKTSLVVAFWPSELKVSYCGHR